MNRSYGHSGCPWTQSGRTAAFLLDSSRPGWINNGSGANAGTPCLHPSDTSSSSVILFLCRTFGLTVPSLPTQKDTERIPRVIVTFCWRVNSTWQSCSCNSTCACCIVMFSYFCLSVCTHRFRISWQIHFFCPCEVSVDPGRKLS